MSSPDRPSPAERIAALLGRKPAPAERPDLPGGPPTDATGQPIHVPPLPTEIEQAQPWGDPYIPDEKLGTIEQAREDRDISMVRADQHASTTWKEAVVALVRDWAQNRPEGFTTDDIWNRLDGEYDTPERRALGPIINGLARSGVIRRTGRDVQSTRRHASRIPVWIGAGFLDVPEHADGLTCAEILTGLYAYAADTSNSRNAILIRIAELTRSLTKE